MLGIRYLLTASYAARAGPDHRGGEVVLGASWKATLLSRTLPLEKRESGSEAR
jgi:hypothetical protein